MSCEVWFRGAVFLPVVLALGAPAAAQSQPAREPAAKRQQGTAPAPQPAPAAGVTVALKPEPSQPEWTKLCGKDPANGAEVCTTTRDFVSDQGQPTLAMAVYDVKARQPRRIVRFLVPHGLLLQPGIRLSVDKGQATPGRFATCLQNGCFAEAEIKDDLLRALRKGERVHVGARNQAGVEVTFALPAEGFAKAYDGPPMDPQVLAEQQRKVQEALQQRSDALRRRLVEQSRGPMPAPTAQASAAPRP